MNVTFNHAKLDHVAVIGGDENCPAFHSLRLVDRTGDRISLYVDYDWSDWDALVAKVAEYRAAEQAAARRNGVGVPVAVERAGVEQ